MKINTHIAASNIVELFEDLLDEHDITIPSEDDDQRDEDNTARLYGMEYWNLVDTVENMLIMLTAQVKNGAEITSYTFEED